MEQPEREEKAVRDDIAACVESMKARGNVGRLTALLHLLDEYERLCGSVEATTAMRAVCNESLKKGKNKFSNGESARGTLNVGGVQELTDALARLPPAKQGKQDKSKPGKGKEQQVPPLMQGLAAPITVAFRFVFADGEGLTAQQAQTAVATVHEELFNNDWRDLRLLGLFPPHTAIAGGWEMWVHAATIDGNVGEELVDLVEDGLYELHRGAAQPRNTPRFFLDACITHNGRTSRQQLSIRFFPPEE